jgi:dual specificity phosphatase 12
MLDHGQLGPPTPALTTPAGSRRPSTTQPGFRPLVNQPRSRPSSLSDSHPRQPSLLSFSGHPESLSTSALETEDDEVVGTAPKLKPSPPSARRVSSGSDRPAIDPFTHLPRALRDSLSALTTEDDSEERKTASPHPEGPSQSGTTHKSGTIPSNISIKALIGRRSLDAVASSPGEHNGASSEPASSEPSPDKVSEPSPAPTGHPSASTQYASASDLAAQLYANPKLAALRSPMNMTPTGTNPVQPAPKSMPVTPPILANPKCSGYFVEPVRLEKSPAM